MKVAFTPPPIPHVHNVCRHFLRCYGYVQQHFPKEIVQLWLALWCTGIYLYNTTKKPHSSLTRWLFQILCGSTRFWSIGLHTDLCNYSGVLGLPHCHIDFSTEAGLRHFALMNCKIVIKFDIYKHSLNQDTVL